MPQHDKEIIQIMLQERKWNPYIIRHSALTMKAKNRMMSDTMLRQHAGWSKESKMPSVYIHNYGSESVDEMLRIQGYLPKENSEFEFNPVGIKKCGNCGTHNLPEAISCSKCKLLIDAVAYQHILKEQEEKDNKLSAMEKQFREMQTQMRSLISAFTGMKEDQRGNLAETLYNSGIVRKIENSNNNNNNKKKVVDNNSDSNDNDDNEVN